MEHGAVALIPVEDIHILNPRVRNLIIAEEIRQNIQSVGLKRPITVTPRKDAKNGKKYDLVCGQGRLEAYISVGEAEIPCVVREVSEEDAHIMSLVENIARRNSNALELLQSIKYLKSQGYEDDAIAAKTNLGKDYIRGIIRLLTTEGFYVHHNALTLEVLGNHLRSLDRDWPKAGFMLRHIWSALHKGPTQSRSSLVGLVAYADQYSAERTQEKRAFADQKAWKTAAKDPNGNLRIRLKEAA